MAMMSFLMTMILAAFVLAQSSSATDYTKYVLPFTGTENGGNMFPGVTRPFGVVKLGPDLFTGSDSYSGYAPTGNITGFSMMHESGTGGAPKYGVVSQMPVVGKVLNPLGDLSLPRAIHDTAEVGYYKSILSSNVSVELAATDHAGMFQYTFPSGKPGSVVIDNYTGGNITIASDGHYEGSGIYNNGWNLAPEWTIYFCGYFDTPSTFRKTFRGSAPSDLKYPARSIEAVERSHRGTNQTTRVGAVYSFSSTTVISRVGISWISSARACEHVNSEIPTGTSLETLVSATKDVWNSQILGKITTTDTNNTNLQLLYSMLYGMLLLPSNRTGENPGWSSSDPYYDDIFTLWDLFRCQTSLFQIVHPVAYEEYIRSLVDVSRHNGWLPDARSSNFNGRTQGGSNADNVLADAYVKGVRGKVNWKDAYAAMVKTAEVVPPNSPVDPQSPESSTHHGRGALADWLKYSYITPKYRRSVSQAADYSLNDFALSQVASGLGLNADANKYLTRSRNWRNHWNPHSTSLNFTGFLAPRFANSSFAPSDPISCGGCYWGDAFYEATPWEYSFAPYHDTATVVKLSGGPQKFTSRLETLFTPNLNPAGSPAFGKTLFNPGNEPSFASPYLFNFASRQDLSVKHSQSIARNYYSPTPSGLPGNSDAGAMQAWLLWNIIGLYPLTGTPTFLISAPWFANLRINLGDSKALTITAKSSSPDSPLQTGPGGKDTYVQSLLVNGTPWNKNWLEWNDIFAQGGTLDFVLGPQPSDWDAKGLTPPSPASSDVLAAEAALGKLGAWLATGDV